MVDKRSDIGR